MFREYVLAESCELAKSTSDVIFRAFLARVSKNFRGRSELDEFAEIKDTSVIGNAPGLLHVVSDNYDGVLRFQFLNQFFDPCRRDRIERRARFVHEDHVGLNRERAGDAKPLLLTAGQSKCIRLQSLFHFIPERGRAQTFLDRFIDLRPSLDSSNAQ